MLVVTVAFIQDMIITRNLEERATQHFIWFCPYNASFGGFVLFYNYVFLQDQNPVLNFGFTHLTVAKVQASYSISYLPPEFVPSTDLVPIFLF